MTGTGTQEDPFVVDNWADFCTIDTNSAEIFVRWADSENKIIDFNDIQPDGYSSTINFPANVDFNGWTLRNFHSTANYAININRGNLIENLIFENFYITQYLMHGAFLLKNCIFSGIAQPAGNVTLFHGCGLQNSSLNVRISSSLNNIEIASGGGFSSPKTQITNSDIILDISCKGLKICETLIKNSRISGKIQANTSSITLGNYSSMSNVFNFESNCPLKYSSSAISVFNSDLAEKSSDSNTSFVGVNSEQLKNAEYLYSIGFPIGVD